VRAAALAAPFKRAVPHKLVKKSKRLDSIKARSGTDGGVRKVFFIREL
jgi:hypothetical protein